MDKCDNAWVDINITNEMTVAEIGVLEMMIAQFHKIHACARTGTI